MAVWTLTGLWHGANFTFIAWGIYYGVLLLIEKKYLHKLLDRIPVPFTHLYALFFVTIGWVFFRSGSLSYAVDYILKMFTPGLEPGRLVLEYLHRFWIYFVLGFLCATPVSQRLKEFKWCRQLAPAGAAGLFLLCVMSLAANSYNPFIYFRF